MKLSELQTKLLTVAKNNPPSDRVPYAFEKRIMAQLKASTTDVWTIWGQALWRAALSCVVIMVLSSAWPVETSDVSEDGTQALSQELDNTVVAALDQHIEDAW